MRNQFHTHLQPQSQREPLDERQVLNEAGGYTYTVDHWTQLRRFLVMGTTGGTFYVGERDLTKQNVESIRKCIDEDGQRVIAEVHEVSNLGLAPSNDPALFVLALVITHGDPIAKRRVAVILPLIARIPTHLFHFVQYATAFRGWGRVLKDAVAGWYKNKPVDQLALHLLKYQSRDSWSNRDLLRLTHPKVEGDRQMLLGWAAGKVETLVLEDDTAARLFDGRARAQDLAAQHKFDEVARVVTECKLPRELLPTEALNYAVVQSALLDGMPLWALIRNLGNLAKHGVLDSRAIAKLTSPEAIAKSRLHPLAVLTAMAAYSAGRSRHGEWSPDRQIIEALEVTLRESIHADKDQRTGKLLVAVDVSGSMDAPSTMNEHFTCAQLGGALACLLVNSNQVDVIAYDDNIKTLPPELLFQNSPFLWAQLFGRMTHGGTDCALPLHYARAQFNQRGTKYIGVLNLTDSMTWAGNTHVPTALRNLRSETQTPVRYVNVQMAADPYTVADPADPLVLECVGFDTSMLPAIKAFLFGQL